MDIEIIINASPAAVIAAAAAIVAVIVWRIIRRAARIFWESEKRSRTHDRRRILPRRSPGKNRNFRPNP